MAAGFTTIDVDVADGVLTITLNRPDALNALNAQMSIELGAALRTAQRERGVRCVVLTGAGRAFCSGQDLRELQERRDAAEGTPEDFGTLLRQRYNPLASRIRTLEKPFIASINGVAAGAGASLALTCDLRICARGAALKMAFVDVGLVPDTAATLTLVQHAGYCHLYTSPSPRDVEESRSNPVSRMLRR